MPLLTAGSTTGPAILIRTLRSASRLPILLHIRTDPEREKSSFNNPVETFMAIGQRLLVFGLGKDRMHVADVLVAPDALVKGVRFTNA